MKPLLKYFEVGKKLKRPWSPSEPRSATGSQPPIIWDIRVKNSSKSRVPLWSTSTSSTIVHLQQYSWLLNFFFLLLYNLSALLPFKSFITINLLHSSHYNLKFSRFWTRGLLRQNNSCFCRLYLMYTVT